MKDGSIRRKLRVDRRKSAPSVKSELEKRLRVLIGESTIRRRAHKVGLFGRIDRKRPYVNRNNLLKRLNPHPHTYVTPSFLPIGAPADPVIITDIHLKVFHCCVQRYEKLLLKMNQDEIFKKN